MATVTKDNSAVKNNGALDIAKVIMAFLVIGIHTEPFGFDFWLDKGFGICTRLCVPFFFVMSAYFFWRRDKSPLVFLQRIIILYVVWSIIYLPFDINELSHMTAPEILRRFLWDGNKHALWYLCGTIIGFSITSVLLMFFKPKFVLMISIAVLVCGCLKTTYSTAVYELFGVDLPDNLGSRNGLFYGFPYIALGMTIAKSNNQGFFKHKDRLYLGFIISLLLLVVESYLFVMFFEADSTILWLSVFPCTYFLFEIALNTTISVNKTTSLTLRKTSTLMYVSQYLFIPVLSKYVTFSMLFILSAFATTVFSIVIIELSDKSSLRFLQYLY